MSSAAPRITYYVILFQPPPDCGSSIRPIARLLKDEEENVRKKLLTKTFEVLARFAKKANAEGMQNQLHALGVETIIVSDQDLRGHLFVGASSASKGAGGIAFRDFDDKPLYTPFEDIAGVTMLEVQCQDGSIATILDLYRKSTSITPRIDAAHFDFPSLLDQPGAGIEEFLTELESHTKVETDRTYGLHEQEILDASVDFGSKPALFAPPDSALKSPYEKDAIKAASIWSFLVYTSTKPDSNG